MRDAVVRGLYAMVVLLGWGLASFLMGLIGKQLPHSAALFCNLLGVIIVNFFFFTDLHLSVTYLHVYAMLAGVLFTVADLAYYKLAEHGMDVSLIGPITSLYILVPVALGSLVLQEPFSMRKAAGVLLAILAMYVLSTAETLDEHKKLHN
jgi:transporter family protein